ncbi:PDZ domain-containing protein [Leptolyngbyaceae cyanobacterium CCMR0082]|uniref:Carboxyl-terminal-processing protease n=1 Tax=Adonisia turfae CCMR0082 TaxID=2304604 RepID=A0A6M0S188_9CYAN|nr:carboxyl-terminal processing protease CtpA [Adonisia turfae]NEZ62237.1 PDZ domain-containing protein [Adonisia turfae CCMR0082]
MRKTGLLHVVLLRGICAICIAIVLSFGVAPLPALAFTEQQKLVMEVWRIVNRAYLDETFNHQNWWFTREKALKRPINNWEDAYKEAQSMLQKLDDPYTRFLPPEQYQSLQTNTSGELLGVGLQIAKDDENQNLRVIAPIVGSPAERAGLSPRDEIIAINGISTQSFSLDEAAARMRGPAGTIVTLKIERSGVTPFEVNLTRERINLNPVFSELRFEQGNQVGYIRLGQFNGNAVEDIRAAITRLEQQQANGYILDLRNNPGGLLQAGIDIARLWLDEGTIVYTVNRQGILESFEAGAGAMTQKPLILLVNGGTASASEILAGALQDNHRALLVGETTFGKGLIQSLFDLSHGSGLAVTVAKYETPDHHDINKLGITPDRTVTNEPITPDQVATTKDVQYKEAVETLMESIMPSLT